MQINTMIIEDELLAMKRMENLLSDIEEVVIVGKASTGAEAVEKANSLRPDLLFVDIELPGMSGFEVISKLEYKPMIIFATAYDQYALKAFDLNSVDYILKPATRERVETAVRRVLARGGATSTDMAEFISAMLKKEKIRRRFSVRRGEEILIIPQEDVYFFKADIKYIFLCTYDREFFVTSTLRDLEATLDPDLFCRIHKSIIISLDKIEKIEKVVASDYWVRMADVERTSFRISRTFLPALKEKLDF